MDLNQEQIKKLSKWLIGMVSVCILIYLGVQNIHVVANTLSWIVDLIWPLILGLFFALILNVPLSFFETRIWKKTERPILRKLRRPVSFLISLAVILAVIVGVVWLVIPELVNAITMISQSVMELIHDLSTMDETALAELPFGSMMQRVDWDELLSSLQVWLKNQSGTIMNTAFGTIGSIVGGVFNFFMAFIFATYVLFGKEKLKKTSHPVDLCLVPRKIWLLGHSCGFCGQCKFPEFCFRANIGGYDPELIVHDWYVYSSPSLRPYDWRVGGGDGLYSHYWRLGCGD